MPSSVNAKDAELLIRISKNCNDLWKMATDNILTIKGTPDTMEGTLQQEFSKASIVEFTERATVFPPKRGRKTFCYNEAYWQKGWCILKTKDRNKPNDPNSWGVCSESCKWFRAYELVNFLG